MDELLTHERPRSFRQPEQKIKERPQDRPQPAGPSDAPPAAPETSSPPARETAASPRQRPGPTPKEKAAQVRGVQPQTAAAPAEPSAPPARTGPADTPARTMRIKERPAVRLKEQRSRTAAPSIKEKPSSLSNPSIPSIKSIESIPSSKERPVQPAAAWTSTPAASRPSRPSIGPRSAPKTDSAPAASRPGMGLRSTPKPGSATAAPAGRTSAGTPRAPAAPGGSRFKREAQQQVFSKARRGLARQPGSSAPQKAASAVNSARSTGEKPLLRARASAKGSAPKIRGTVYRKGISGPKAARAPVKEPLIKSPCRKKM